MATVTRLYIYPIKSCRGVRLEQAELSNTGFKNDRLYMLVHNEKGDDGGHKFMTMREYSRMALICTKFNFEGSKPMIDVTFSGADGMSIQIPLNPTKEELGALNVIDTHVFKTPVDAYDMGDDYANFFSRALEIECRLVYRGPEPRILEGNKPPENTQNGNPLITGFADGFPYLVTSTESMDDLNKKLEEPIDIERFRPNIVVTGTKGPWDEDTWKQVVIGEAGVRGRQPYLTLQKFRRVDKGVPYSPIFGLNAIANNICRALPSL